MRLIVVVIGILPQNYYSQSLQGCQFECTKRFVRIRKYTMLAAFNAYESLQRMEIGR